MSPPRAQADEIDRGNSEALGLGAGTDNATSALARLVSHRLHRLAVTYAQLDRRMVELEAHVDHIEAAIAELRAAADRVVIA